MTSLDFSPHDERQAPELFLAKCSRSRIVIVWAVAVVFTFLAVHWSARNARLAQDPTYDDVGYFVEATERLAILDHQGVTGLIKDIIHRPPHSTFSMLFGMASFMVLGINDWAPYAFNVFVVAALLLFCCRIFGDLPAVPFYSLLIYCLTIPFSLRAIHDFRPDFTAALATAVFVWIGLLSVTGREENEAKNAFWGGSVFGAALWIKPSIFAHTLAIGFVVSVLIVFGGWLPLLCVRSLKRSLVNALRFGGTGLVLGSPYFYLNGRQILNYVIVNTQGVDAHIGSFKGSTWSYIESFLATGVQSFTFGPHLWLMLGCCFAGIIWALRTRRYALVYQISGVLLAATASVTIFIYGRHNNEYFGLPYQITVVFAGLGSLAAIIRSNRLTAPAAPLLLLISFTPPFFLPWGKFWVPAEEANQKYGWNRIIVDAITADSAYQRNEPDRLPGPIPVFLNFAGSVNGNSMRWICIKDGLPFIFSDLHRVGDVTAQLAAAHEAAYVVTCTPEATSNYAALPSGETYAAVTQAIQTDPNFREVKLHCGGPIAAYRLFLNLPKADEFTTRYSLSIGWPSTGFLTPEGPYPQWNLPKVRWSTFPGSTITVSVPEATTGMLKFSVQADAGSIVQVKLNDQQIGAHEQKSSTFEWSEYSLPLRAGDNVISLNYQVPNSPAGPGTRALLFRHIDVSAGH